MPICFNEAQHLQVDLPLAKFVDNKYKKLQMNGHSRSDTSALIKQFDND
jgi:3-hydroxyisobutyrate dehydrogenase-like beta-hydroxyacid dehydrogenase